MTATMIDLGLDSVRFPDEKVELLRMMLSIAVPLRIEQYQSEYWTADQLIDRARHVWGEECAGKQHEALIYRIDAKPKKRLPGTAQVFNWFVEAIACAALVADGGIRVLGLRFDAEIRVPQGGAS